MDNYDTNTADSGTWITSFPSQLDITSTTNCGNVLSFTSYTNWNFRNNYNIWPKGIEDPEIEFKYTPKWHIIQGYKNQITKMWD